MFIIWISYSSISTVHKVIPRIALGGGSNDITFAWDLLEASHRFVLSSRVVAPHVPGIRFYTVYANGFLDPTDERYSQDNQVTYHRPALDYKIRHLNKS